MGTDWRVNDPVIEPAVGIMRGARMNCEYVGASLSANNDEPGNAPSGYRPIGMVRKTWNKGCGFRLGVTVGSDHGSTHYSYTMVYTDRLSREGILGSIRRRHTYGASDNILLDVRMADHFMGDEFHASEPEPNLCQGARYNCCLPREVFGGERVVCVHEPESQEAEFEFLDQDDVAGTGTWRCYLRVEQSDGQVAWASPFWVSS